MLPYRIRDYPSYNRIQLYFLCNHSGHTIHVNTWVFHRVSQIPATTGRPGYPSQPVQMPQLPHSETPVSVWREGHRVGSDRQADATVHEKTKAVEKVSCMHARPYCVLPVFGRFCLFFNTFGIVPTQAMRIWHDTVNGLGR